MDEFNPDRIPPCVRIALDNYNERGLWPGNTTHRLLAGDVFGAFSYADDATRAALPAIVAYVQRVMPASAYGSKEKVNAWLNTHAVRSA